MLALLRLHQSEGKQGNGADLGTCKLVSVQRARVFIDWDQPHREQAEAGVGGEEKWVWRGK